MTREYIDDTRGGNLVKCRPVTRSGTGSVAVAEVVSRGSRIELLVVYSGTRMHHSGTRLGCGTGEEARLTMFRVRCARKSPKVASLVD